MRLAGLFAVLAVAAGSLAQESGLGGDRRGTQGQEIVEGALGRELDRAVLVSTYGQMRGVVLVIKDGKVALAKGYGLANRELAPVTADTLFELASVTKAFTAAAILRLEMAGKLSTDDPISTHLDGVPADKAGITIHHLLTHTSGLGSPDVDFAADEREPVVRALLSRPLESEPGTRHEYSNPGYWLVAAIIERASGTTYEKYLRDEVFVPAGMTASLSQGDAVTNPARVADRVVHGERTGDAATCPYAFGWGYRGSGGVVTSARDMIAWDKALRDGPLLSTAARTKMFTPGADDYGYGWFVTTGPLGRVAKHTGGVAGFGVSYIHWLDRDAAVVVMTGDTHDPVRLSNELANVIFPELVERLSAVMRPGAHRKEGEFMARLPDATGFVVRFEKGDAIVSFKPPGDAEAALELRLSPVAATRVAGELRRHAAAIKATSSPSPPIITELYPASYKDVGGVITLDSRALTLVAMPGTPHPEEGGRLRVTLIVQDPEHHMWPVFVKLAAERATQLSDALDPPAE